jgi:hypothetical protein
VAVVVMTQNVDRLRIDVEADLARGWINGRLDRYAVTRIDALSDREFDWPNTGGMHAQSIEVGVFHAAIVPQSSESGPSGHESVSGF